MEKSQDTKINFIGGSGFENLGRGLQQHPPPRRRVTKKKKKKKSLVRQGLTLK